MTLKPQSIEIPFTRGMAQDIDPKLAPAGTFKRLINYEFDKTGRLKKRGGYEEVLGTSASDCGTYRVTEWRGQKVRLHDSAAKGTILHGGTARLNVEDKGTLLGEATDWRTLNHALASEITDYPAAVERGTKIYACGCASRNDFTLFAWLDGSEVGYQINSVSTGKYYSGSSLTAPTLGTPSWRELSFRVFRWANWLCVAWLDDSDDLKVWRFDTTDGTTETLTKSGSYENPFDVVWGTSDGTDCFVLLTESGEPISTAVHRIDSDLATLYSNGLSNLPTVNSDACLARAGTRVACLWAGADCWVTAMDAADLANQGTEYEVHNLTGVGQPTCCLVPLNDSNQYQILLGLTQSASPVHDLTYVATWQDGGAPATETTMHGCRPASRGFAHHNDEYAFVVLYRGENIDASYAYQDDWSGPPTGYQRQYALFWLDYGQAPMFAGRFGWRRAVGHPAAIPSVNASYCGKLETTDDRWVFCAPETIAGDAREASLNDVHAYDIAFTTYDRGQFAELGQLFLGGSLPSQYDGRRITEIGLIQAPDQVSVSESAPGGVPIGSYQYRFTYETIDATGAVIRSAPSLPLPVELAAASDVTLEIQELGAFTRHADYAVRVWRTKDSGDLFYLVGEVSGSTAADGFVAFIDDNDDDSLQLETLYTDSGELAEWHPPSCTALCQHGTRLVVAHGSKLYYSKTVRKGFGVGFNESSLLEVGDTVTGLISRGDVLLVFCENSIWAIWGEGPDALGNGQFSVPQLVTSSFGAPQRLGGQRSLCVTEHGIVFRSAKGISLMPLGLGAPVIISGSVEDYLGFSDVVTSAVVVDSEQRVKFTMGTTGAPYSATKRIIVWDYADFAAAPPGLWYVEESAYHRGLLSAALWDSEYVFASAYHDAVYEHGSSGRDETTNITSTLETNVLYPFGHGEEGRLYRTFLTGTVEGDTTLSVAISFDGGVSNEQSTQLSVTDGDAMPLEYRTRQQKFVGVSFTIDDASSTDGVWLNSMTLLAAHRKRGRVSTGQRFTPYSP